MPALLGSVCVCVCVCVCVFVAHFHLFLVEALSALLPLCESLLSEIELSLCVLFPLLSAHGMASREKMYVYMYIYTGYTLTKSYIELIVLLVLYFRVGCCVECASPSVTHTHTHTKKRRSSQRLLT